MKRASIVIVLLIILYFLTQVVISRVQTFTNSASVIMSGVNTAELHELIRNHYNEHVFKHEKELASGAKIIPTPAYINSDQDLDIVVRVESDDTCGSGGCITTIFLQTDIGTFEPVPFTYAIKSFKVLETLTNQMHDIQVNGDGLITWDGSKYTVSASN
jgi:hypothetical protein